MDDCDTLKASNELRILKNYHLLQSKGKGKATYYLAGKSPSTEPCSLNTEPQNNIDNEDITLSTEPLAILSTEPPAVLSTEPVINLSTEANAVDRVRLLNEIPKALADKILELKGRESNTEKIKEVITELVG